MLRFDYVKPATLEEACRFLSQHVGHAWPLAGGTDLMVQIRAKSRRLQALEYVVDLGALAGLKGIREENGTVTIGALATHTEVSVSPVVRSTAPLLATACAQVGGPQTRNLGTVGGNLCNASLSADSVTALVALDAQALVTGPEGDRILPVAEVLVKNEENALHPGEILTAIKFQALGKDTSCAFVKLGRRKALSISRANVAVCLEQSGGTVTAARIAVGACFPTTRRVAAAETLLLGQTPTPEVLQAAGEAVSGAMIALTGVRWSTEYKQPVVQTLVRRALEQALEG